MGTYFGPNAVLGPLSTVSQGKGGGGGGTAPVNTVLPVISPSSGSVGQAFTVSNGTWTGSPTGYAYQWYKNGAVIPLAVASSYTAAASGTLTVVVFAIKPNSPAGQATALGVTVTGAPAVTGGRLAFNVSANFIYQMMTQAA